MQQLALDYADTSGDASETALANPETRIRDFYDDRRSDNYGDEFTGRPAEEHPIYPRLVEFIERYGLANKRCLEIGSSGGANQDLVEDFWGTDIAESLAKHYHKPYRVADGARYPFEDGMFDAIWSISVFEHIPDLQTAMQEIIRLLKPGGVLFFKPAWQCRPWAAEGYQVRPYSDFGLWGKLVKASIPLRDSVVWRSLFVFPKRFWRHLSYLLGHRYREILYRRLKANWEIFWTCDSDACNSIDPHDAILWLESHGVKCLSHPLPWRAFFVRTGGLVFRKEPVPEPAE
jgi:SAM-dependent methyltransferase